MNHWTTRGGYTVSQLLSGRSNSFLISFDSQYIVIDTGMKHTSGKWMRAVRSFTSPGERINYLILTHTHMDHCQNTALLKEEEGCNIIVSENEAPYAREGYTPLPKGTRRFSRSLSRLGNLMGSRGFRYRPFDTDITVKDHFSIHEYDLDIEIIATPGHSSGSISILVNGEIALVGDAMFGISSNSVFPPFADDIPQMIRSWKKLLDTGCHTFLPGHGRPIQRELLKTQYDHYH